MGTSAETKTFVCRGCGARISYETPDVVGGNPCPTCNTEMTSLTSSSSPLGYDCTHRGWVEVRPNELASYRVVVDNEIYLVGDVLIDHVEPDLDDDTRYDRVDCCIADDTARIYTEAVA
jgi:hypothetical protein